MNIGIIGPAKSGKTTIFNALTGQNAETADYGTGKVEPNRGVVTVLDDRLDRLSAMYNPKKTVPAVIDFLDFVGVSQGAAQGGLFSGEGMALIKTADALVAVLRNFSNETLDAQFGPPDPARDLERVDAELLLDDLIVAEKRLERIRADHLRGKKNAASQAEEKLMASIVQALEEGHPIRSLDLSTDDKKILQGFQFLTAKPLLAILNSDEESYGRGGLPDAKHPVIEFAGKFEMELAGLDEEDREGFMTDMGITESARARLTHFAYQMLGYISFFTVGDDEVRAWTLRQGRSAVEAAGAIHSDLARGFIRAECFTAQDLLSLGSEKAVKDKGLFRLEGKEYTVRDGDVLHVRFSI